jgi:GMP synthase (glutamine-hydrolysing)
VARAGQTDAGQACSPACAALKLSAMEAPLNILCVQNDAIGPAGIVGEQIFRRGGLLDEVMPHDGDALPADHGRYDGVVVLGGAMDAFDDENYPQFWPLIRLIQGFHAADKPILGVCLGAQLVARTFEKPVYRHRELELGFTEVTITDAGAATPPFLGLDRRQWVMEWHQDTFDLPDGAELLVTGERCRNQAFRIGEHVYAFQFHFEATKAIVRMWVKTQMEVLKRQHPYFPAQIERDFALHIANQATLARRISNAWLDLVEARAGRRELSKAG